MPKCDHLDYCSRCRDRIATLEAENQLLKLQIDQLANFIMAEVEGEPCQSEGAVDCAIRIIRQMQVALTVNGYTDLQRQLTEAKQRYDPPAFLRDEWDALPQKSKDFIAALETNADPAGMVRENEALRQNCEGLQLKLAEAKAALGDIAKGMIEADSEPRKIFESATPAEFQSAMWTWSQKRAREALAAKEKA